MAFTILTALALGVMIFLSHLVTFVKQDRILDWLIPLCFFLLSFAVVSIFITLIVAGTDLYNDVQELRYSWSLVEQAVNNSNEDRPFHSLISFALLSSVSFRNRDRLLARCSKEPNGREIRRQTWLVLRIGSVGFTIFNRLISALCIDVSCEKATRNSWMRTIIFRVYSLRKKNCLFASRVHHSLTDRSNVIQPRTIGIAISFLRK